ncbi:MAG: LysR family transcriptional regulator [Hydrogenophaga sp.]|nr:LysR family transcriptional regulator [Hydrogenophaga sp.]
MARDNISDLMAFVAVAREQSFTRAAGRLGVSQSAISHTIRSLEARMGVRLLIRTTRSVSPTEAGERLLKTVEPQLEEIEAELAALRDLGGKPAGTIRITATDHAANTVLRPRLLRLLQEHPDLKVEIHTDNEQTDFSERHYDLGVRWGDQVAKDMIAVRIASDMRRVIVASPDYLVRRAAPKSPHDLLMHDCISLRLPDGGLHEWELRNGKHELQVKVDGRTTFNGVYQVLTAALDGYGLAFVPEDLAKPHVDAGSLRYVLPAWHPIFPGLHVCYYKRRRHSQALSLVVEALRKR